MTTKKTWKDLVVRSAVFGYDLPMEGLGVVMQISESSVAVYGKWGDGYHQGWVGRGSFDNGYMEILPSKAGFCLQAPDGRYRSGDRAALTPSIRDAAAWCSLAAAGRTRDSGYPGDVIVPWYGGALPGSVECGIEFDSASEKKEPRKAASAINEQERAVIVGEGAHMIALGVSGCVYVGAGQRVADSKEEVFRAFLAFHTAELEKRPADLEPRDRTISNQARRIASIEHDLLREREQTSLETTWLKNELRRLDSKLWDARYNKRKESK
jgi:hypothetical protein